MDSSTPCFPVLHHLPEFAQTHVHWVSNAIQPSNPLWSPSLPAGNGSQHQGIFQSQLFISSGLEEGMVTHSSILSWRVPWTEEPDRLLLHRVSKFWTQLKRLNMHACTSSEPWFFFSHSKSLRLLFLLYISVLKQKKIISAFKGSRDYIEATRVIEDLFCNVILITSLESLLPSNATYSQIWKEEVDMRGRGHSAHHTIQMDIFYKQSDLS